MSAAEAIRHAPGDAGARSACFGRLAALDEAIGAAIEALDGERIAWLVTERGEVVERLRALHAEKPLPAEALGAACARHRKLEGGTRAALDSLRGKLDETHVRSTAARRYAASPGSR